MRSSVKQVRVCLEEIGDVYRKFQEEVYNEYGFVNNYTCKVERRGIGIKFAFGEEIHRSDDEITYFLKEDKAVGMIIIRRTEFNNAEITMIKTSERTFKIKKYK